MTDLTIDILRTIIVAGIFLYLFMVGKRQNIHTQAGWNYIVLGFALLVIGMGVDFLNDIPLIKRYIAYDNNLYYSFFENIVGYLAGFIMLAIGFQKWIPGVAASNRVNSAIPSATVSTSYPHRRRRLAIALRAKGSSSARSSLASLSSASRS